MNSGTTAALIVVGGLVAVVAIIVATRPKPREVSPLEQLGGAVGRIVNAWT